MHLDNFFKDVISFHSLKRSVLHENTEVRLHNTGSRRKKYLVVYILRLILRLVESNRRKENLKKERNLKNNLQ